MATTFDKEFGSESHHGGRVRKTVPPKGRAARFVAERYSDGKLRRKTFDTRKAAIDHLKSLGAARDRHGQIVSALTGAELRDAKDALHRLREGGRPESLCAAVDFFLQHHAPHGKGLSVSALMDAYEQAAMNPTDGSSPARPDTFTTKRRHLASFLESHGEKDVFTITNHDVEAWLATYQDLAPRTQRNKRTEIQALFNAAERLVPEYVNTVAKFPQRKPKEVPPAEIYSTAEARKLLRWMEKKAKPENVITLACGLFAGLRPDETMRVDGNHMTWANVDLKKRILHVPARAAKTREFRDVPICDALAMYLTTYRGQAAETDRLGSSRKSFENARTKAAEGLELRWITDGLRHTYGTNRAQLDGAHAAAESMGHTGGLKIFNAHYRGLTHDKAARAFFAIRPLKKANGLKKQVAAA